MIKEIKCYTLICDNCGADVIKSNRYTKEPDAKFCIGIAIENDWIEHEDKHYCPDCYYYDNEDVFYIVKSRTKEVKND